MNYVGIDHHRQYSHLTVMDQHQGQVGEGEGKFFYDDLKKLIFLFQIFKLF